MLFEIGSLGFGTVELSFNLTSNMVDQLEAALPGSGIKVGSVHNFCPIPDKLPRKIALPDCYSMSSLSTELRRKSVFFAKRSIDTARRLGAKAVVLHCGRVEIADKTKPFIAAYRKSRDKKFLSRLRDELVGERNKAAGPYLNNTLSSLEELEPYARSRGIKLGIENRNYYREIPALDELSVIFGRFKGSSIGYWHDTGHAQIMQELGICRQEDYLDRFGGALVGLHLHDVINCRDHMAPAAGRIDFSFFRPYIKKDTILVIEAHHPAAASSLIKARDHLKKVLGYGQ